MNRVWQTAVDVALFLALWAVAPLLLGGCGDDPCGACPSGSTCEQVPSGSLTTQRWACRTTVKVIERRWLLSTDGASDGGQAVGD